MADEKKIRIDGADEAARKIRRITPVVINAIKRIFTRETVVLASYIRATHMTMGPTDISTKTRSGQLRASTKPRPVTVTGEVIEGGIQFGTAYGRTHVGPKGQLTTIKPTAGKQYLTIPLPAAKTASGVARGAAQSGAYGETFFARSKKGNLILFGKLKAQKGAHAGETRGDVVPLFLLVKSVTVKSRIHPEDIVQRFAKPRILSAFKEIGIDLKSM